MCVCEIEGVCVHASFCAGCAPERMYACVPLFGHRSPTCMCVHISEHTCVCVYVKANVCVICDYDAKLED